MEIRALTPEDGPAMVRLSREAFGGPSPSVDALQWHEGIRRWGVFDGRTLVAKLNDRDYLSGIRGRDVSTAGIAGVAVVPEYRGRGVAGRLMTHALRAARDRGAAVSTLFRTVPGMYRALGYEQVAEQVVGEYPAGALSRLRVPHGIVGRRATAADAAAIRAVYGRVVDEGSCLLTRTGPNFAATDEEMVGSFDGISLACDVGGAVLGYASWQRGTGWGRGAALEVSDLLAVTAPALVALLAMVGSFEAVTPAVRIRTSGQDPVPWVVPGAGWAVDSVQPYMLRVLGLRAAIESAGWPRGIDVAVDVELSDPLLPANDGRHRLEIADGRGTLAAGGSGAVRITPQGAAVLVAGGSSVAAMRRAGLVGPAPERTDAALDAIMAGPRPAILDFF